MAIYFYNVRGQKGELLTVEKKGKMFMACANLRKEKKSVRAFASKTFLNKIFSIRDSRQVTFQIRKTTLCPVLEKLPRLKTTTKTKYLFFSFSNVIRFRSSFCCLIKKAFLVTSPDSFCSQFHGTRLRLQPDLLKYSAEVKLQSAVAEWLFRSTAIFHLTLERYPLYLG